MPRTGSPAVSVLIPARDAVSTIGACLRSVLRQTETDWECVLVDDGSRDRTVPAALSACDGDPRLRVVRGRHRGIVAALNRGAAECRGRYVARMDADDCMHRDRLRAQRECLDAHPNLAMVGTHVRIFPRSEVGPGLRDYERWLNAMESPGDIRRDLFVECPLAHPTLMIRRDVLASTRYRDTGWPEDYDLLMRVLLGGGSAGVVPRRLLSWRNRPERLSRTDPTYGIDRFTRCKAEFLSASHLRGHDRYALWGYGMTGRTLQRALRGHGKRVGFIFDLHPGRLGNRIHGAPVLAPESLGSIPAMPHVVCVSGDERRSAVRGVLREHGLLELRDFVCAS